MDVPGRGNAYVAFGAVFDVSVKSFAFDVAPAGGSVGESFLTAEVVSEKNL